MAHRNHKRVTHHAKVPKKTWRTKKPQAQQFVQKKFPASRIVHHHILVKFRVYLQWRTEPNFHYWDTKEQAWEEAYEFLMAGGLPSALDKRLSRHIY